METFEFEKNFNAIAFNLLDSYGLLWDHLLKDDLMQEMRIRVMSMTRGEKKGYYLKAAKWAAKNFIYYWTSHFKIKSASTIDADFDLEYFHYKNGSCWNDDFLKNRNGENSSRAKLTNEDITNIRIDYAINNKTIYQIAQKYPVCYQQIHKIVQNKIYKKYNHNKYVIKKPHNTNAKLTNEQVEYVRNSNKPHRVIAREINISESSIRGIRNGKLYKSVKP